MATEPAARPAPGHGGPGIEVERKFLVSGPPGGLERYPAKRLEQGYIVIAGDGTEVRVRRADRRTTLTVKRGTGRVRVEEEIEIEPERFTRLWGLTEGRRLEKTRHELPVGPDLTAELDVYAGRLAGLMTAEVEFPSADEAEAFVPPEWFGAEITDDRRYANQRLATDGPPV
jgi:CYTH domain-containing protein